MSLRPAMFSTPEPPHIVEDVELREYIFSIRRRVETLNIQLEALAEQLQDTRRERDALKTEIERLSLDLHHLNRP